MSMYEINERTGDDEIEDFYNLYINSYKNLCIWNDGTEDMLIIDLNDYISNTENIDEFKEYIKFITYGLGLIIYYTRNNEMITAISFVEIEPLYNCYVKIKILCGNRLTRENKINGKSQGINMLDFIFNKYQNYIILIEPATPQLITYYTNYKKPCFPYSKETMGYLIYGNIMTLRDPCFALIFQSIKNIYYLMKKLGYSSLVDIYNNTHDVDSLKHKLLNKLREIQMSSKYFDRETLRELVNKINDIDYYNIDDIIVESRMFTEESDYSNLIAGKKRKMKSRKMKSRKMKSRKMKSKKNLYGKKMKSRKNKTKRVKN